METHAQAASKALRVAEKKLQHELDKREPDFVQLEPLLETFRIHNGNDSLSTYYLTNDSAEATESKLWDAHVKVNGKFKVLLKTFREGEGKKKHVERRKAEKLYLEFIKASQRFYRAYIQRLASNFSGIPQIHEAARVLSLETLSTQQTKHASPELREWLERSCKQIIVRLGDLSRWRETELSRKERNWGPATGYYQFALVLDPANGVCYNQLAVIAQADDHHLNTVYYFHRAAAVEKPSPTAIDNIKLKFEKLLKSGSDDTLGTVDMSDDIVSVLEKRFLAFHAECHIRPFDFVSFTQKATDIVRLFAIGFEETEDEAFDGLLAKICLINIAAEHLANQGSTGNILHKQLSEDKLHQETERSRQTFSLLRRFNMMTFQALLKILSRELEDMPSKTAAGNADLSHISLTARRVVSNLRQYSSWLLSNVGDLTKLKFKSSRKVMEQVWQVYVQALNLLLGNVDVFSPSDIGYLLKEDEDTSAFVPFAPKVKEWRFKPSGSMKPSFDPKMHVSSSDLEFHLRATDIVIDALRLVKHQDDLNLKDSPVSLNGQSFEYHPLPEPEIPLAPTSPPKTLWRSRAHVHAASLNGTPMATTPEPDQTSSHVHAAKQVDTANTDISMADQDQSAMEHMVSDLVDSKPESSTGFKSVAVQPFSPANPSGATTVRARPESSQLTAMDLVRKMQRSSMEAANPQSSPQLGFNNPNSSIPTVYHTAFTPTAGENATFGSRPGTRQGSSPRIAEAMQFGGVFREQLAQQARDTDLRSSPQPANVWEAFGQTPANMQAGFRAPQQGYQHDALYVNPPSNRIEHTMPSPQQTYGLYRGTGQSRPTSQNGPNGRFS